ncbi:VQ motif-containing protein 9-like [Punica granatum]|uniref:VQ motif-containing protein 9-like n=1 Tax=Punica granatum TaxID=22663 RepID=A0A218X8Z6_PUNGR|nr:VQ motif-containing protein 9-like [Punica granatum]OWM80991.1 hypothetical protein CDL15_Pgr007022 [Punica granatum]
MEKSSCHSTADSTTSSTGSSGKDNNNNNNNPYLKHLSLNKLSHKISKPPSFARSALDPNSNPGSVLDHHHHPGNLQQPPVYNINKSDFREVVQKLTGSPAHERLSSPPPIQPPKPPSSRLQRIRPPPLAQLGVRPSTLLNAAPSFPQNQNPIPNNQIPISAPTSLAAGTSTNSGVASEFNPIGRPIAPLSPLPPMPAVYAAAESPVSAYMRYLQSTASGDSSRPLLFSGFPPMAPPATVPPPASASAAPPPSPPFQLPLSPLPFGCLNSPRSPHPLLSPGLLFLPTSGQLGFPQFPLSPTVPVPVPVPSPTYKGGI